jgi:hypothetical protein
MGASADRRRIHVLKAVAFSLVMVLEIAAAPGAAPEKDRGPKLGSVVPAFNLPDQNNIKRGLADLAGEKGVVLLFHRSADW